MTTELLRQYLKLKTNFVKKDGKKIVLGALKELFDQLPDLEKVNWNQYIPVGYNDGDAAYPRIDKVGFCFRDTAKQPENNNSEDLDEEEEWEDEDGREVEGKHYSDIEDKKVQKLCKEFDDIIHFLLDEMMTVFGDQSLITIDRKGKLKVTDSEAAYDY